VANNKRRELAVVRKVQLFRWKENLVVWKSLDPTGKGSQ